MADPFSIAGGALSLTSVLIKVHQEHAKNPSRAPGLADIMKSIPDTVFQISNRITATVNELEKDCDKAGLDPKKTLDELKTDPGFWLSRRRRALDNFEMRVKEIREEIAVLFDDVVAISNCSGAEELIAVSYAQALEAKDALRRDTGEDVPIGKIMDNLRSASEKMRAQIGDMGKNKN
jgi:hypothetical protein